MARRAAARPAGAARNTEGYGAAVALLTVLGGGQALFPATPKAWAVSWVAIFGVYAWAVWKHSRSHDFLAFYFLGNSKGSIHVEIEVAIANRTTDQAAQLVFRFFDGTDELWRQEDDPYRLNLRRPVHVPSQQRIKGTLVFHRVLMGRTSSEVPDFKWEDVTLRAEDLISGDSKIFKPHGGSIEVPIIWKQS
jgi:hypothetical protein